MITFPQCLNIERVLLTRSSSLYVSSTKMPPKRVVEDFFHVTAAKKRKNGISKVQDDTAVSGTTQSELPVENKIATLSVSGTPQNEEPTLNGPSESPLCNSLCCSTLLMDQPYQPPLADFDSQNKGRSFQQSWYYDFPWLTLCTTTGKAFCHTCRQAVSQGLMT